MIRPYYRADQFLGWTVWVDNPLGAEPVGCFAQYKHAVLFVRALEAA